MRTFGEEQDLRHPRVETRFRTRAGIKPTASWLVMSESGHSRRPLKLTQRCPSVWKSSSAVLTRCDMAVGTATSARDAGTTGTGPSVVSWTT
jgi:hypothetical protein